MKVGNIIKDDDGGLPEIWLSLFRNWLLKLQDAYDQDKERGLIDDEGWTKEAFDGAILASKLLVPTVPTVQTIRWTRVGDGIINPAPGL